MAEIREELHVYLNKNNLNELLAKIVEAILLDKPANPIGYITYMANIFLENFPEETRDVAASLRREKPPDLVVTTTPGDEERSEAVFVPRTLIQQRRGSVSAETIMSCVVEESQLKLIAKIHRRRGRGRVHR